MIFTTYNLYGWATLGYASVPETYAQCTFSSWRVRSVHASVPDTYAQCMHQFLARTLSACISSWRVSLSACISSWRVRSVHASVPDVYRSVHASVPDVYAQCTRQSLMRTLSARISYLRVCSACFEATFYSFEFLCKKLMRILRVCISSWHVCSGCFEGTFSNVKCAFSARISFRRICSVHALVPDAYAQPRHQFVIRKLSFRNTILHVHR